MQMHIDLSYNKEAEEKILKLKKFLAENGLAFYTLSERNLGNQQYLDINISIKLA